MQFRWVINKRYGLYREEKAVRPSVGTQRQNQAFGGYAKTETLVSNLSFSRLQTQSVSKELKYAQLIMTCFVIFY